jgi:hypothetical protein
MEPRFKIIGNEVKEQSRVEEPQPAVSPAMWQYYNREMIAYEQHIKSLRTYIASPGLKERFGDNEFGEMDFEVKNVRVDWNCLDGYEYGDMAFPVSQEQESQEEHSSPLWVEVEKIAWLYRSGKINYIGMMKMLQRDFEIKRRNTTQ